MAITTLTEQIAGISPEKFQEIATKILAQHDIEERGAIRQLQKATQNAHLFIQSGNNHHRFLSPIWRDFLAATHLWQHRQQETIAQNLHNAEWDNVIQFYVGRSGAGIFADQLLDTDNDNPLYDNLMRLASWTPHVIDEGEWRRKLLLQLGRLIMNNTIPTVLRQRAILAMAQTKENGVLTFLRQLIQADQAFLRQTAIAALANVRSDASRDILIRSINSSDVGIRQNAIYALIWINDPAAERNILSALYHDDDLVRQIAAEGLALRGKNSIEILQEAVEDMDPRVRRAAVFGLILLNEDWVLPTLELLEEDEQWAVQSVANAGREQLTRTDETAMWQPISLADQEWLIGWAAQQGRGVPVGDGAFSVLTEALAGEQEEEVRIMAVMMFAQTGQRTGATALKQALLDDKNTVKQAAFLALCQLSRIHGEWLG
jgi:HEAT repeat protein